MSAASETALYTTAARALLKRTGIYTEASLMSFLAERYPEIPEEHRHPLMIGAVTGAQTAAQLHVLLEGIKHGRDRDSRTTAEGARRTLSLYNLGLISEELDDPYPLGQVPPPEELPFVYEELPEEIPPRGPPEPQPSTYQQSSSRRPALRRQSPARGAPNRGRSTSPRGRHQTSSSRSPERRGPSKERRDYDRSRHH